MMDQDAVVKKAICPVCGAGCHVNATAVGGKITKIEPDPESLSNRSLCERAVVATEYHDGPRRLNYLLKKQGGRGAGKWQRISWEQAMEEIARKLYDIRERYGPEAVAVLWGSPHGAADPSAWKWCNLWGTPNLFHLGKNCGEAEFLTECAMYGYDTGAGWIEGPITGRTGVAILWGANLSESSPGLWRLWTRARNQGVKIVVVDPRPTRCARESDIWVQLRPGTDGALAMGMLNVIINENLYDKEFVAKWCLGFD